MCQLHMLLLRRLIPLSLLLLAACGAAESEDDSDSSTGAVSAKPKDSESLTTYLGQFKAPTDASAWKTYKLSAVHGLAATLDIETTGSVEFDLNIHATGEPPQTSSTDLDTPPPSELKVIPKLVFVAASTKDHPLKSIPKDSVNRDIPSSSVDLPDSAVIADTKAMDGDGTISITEVKRTDLGLRVVFTLPRGYVPGSAQLSLLCKKGCK